MSKELFDRDITPHLLAIEAICAEYEIPFVMCFQLEDMQENGTILFAGASQVTSKSSGRIRLLARLAETPALDLLSSLVADISARTVDKCSQTKN